MFPNSRLTTIPGFLRVFQNIMLTRSQLAAIKSHFVVKQDKEAQIFYADIGKYRAFIEYEEEGNVLRLLETKVPEELEGHGIGKQLAKATFDQITRQGQKVDIQCDFLQHFVDRYGNEYKKLIVK